MAISSITSNFFPTLNYGDSNRAANTVSSASTQQAEALFQQLDPDSDGVVSQEEFVAGVSAYLDAQNGSDSTDGTTEATSDTTSLGDSLLAAIAAAKEMWSSNATNSPSEPMSQGEMMLAAIAGRPILPEPPPASSEPSEPSQPTNNPATDSYTNIGNLGGLPILFYGEA